MPVPRLSFTPGFWSFSFAYAAAVSDALVWLAITLLTAFVWWIAFRTVLLAVRGQLLLHGPMRRQALPAGRPAPFAAIRRGRSAAAAGRRQRRRRSR